MEKPKRMPPMATPILKPEKGGCEYCGCLLPDEYHPNCKQCGGPRKAARDKVVRPRWGLSDFPSASTGFLVPDEFRARPLPPPGPGEEFK